MYVAALDEVGDAVSYDASLAAAGACDDEHGSADGLDGLALPGVELGEDVVWHGGIIASCGGWW